MPQQPPQRARGSQRTRVPHVFLVDDNVDDLALASLVLTKAYPDARLDRADNAISFGELFERGGFDVVVTAYELSWTDGLTVLEAVKERWPRVSVVMLAESADERFATEAMKRGLDDFLVKSSRSFVQLPDVVNGALERVEAKRSESRLETRLQTLLEQSNVGVFRSTVDGRLLEVNGAFLRLVGRETLAEACDLDWRSLLVPGDGPDPVQLFDDAGRFSRQVELQLPDGSTRWLSVSEMILLDGEGDLVIDGLVQDVSVHQHSHSSLQQQSRESGQPIVDIERFAALASHELREPLRMIEKYTQLLAEQYGNRLDVEAAEYISHALDGAQRLQKLIGDLLTFSQVEAAPQRFDRVGCKEVVDRVLEDLRARIKASGAIITVDHLPSVMGDRAQLELLFKNLIDNALKFHRAETPKVRISAVQQYEDWLFAVRDNGVGVDGEHRDDIFSVFTRLRPEVPGSGVGLAICKRVVEYHGGRLWVESEPGEGSVFQFTIPLRRGRVTGRPADGSEISREL